MLGSHTNPDTISLFLSNVINDQSHFEKKLKNVVKKQNGVFFTNSIHIIDNVLSEIPIDREIINKRILEPSCGQGIFLLKLISDIYRFYPNEEFIYKFISNSLFFIDIDKQMIEKAKTNIEQLFKFLFGKTYSGNYNSIIWDFTDKGYANSLFNETGMNPFSELYGTFDYIIGNPPFVTLYGRRDKKLNEQQRINYLRNYNQFPESLKNGKINLIMLFIEHSIDLLKENGKLSFIIDVSFFETAYKYTRKFLLENTIINELNVNIKDFEVASGQVILKLTKSKLKAENSVKIIDHKNNNTHFINQSEWNVKDDEYKFRFNGCHISGKIINKIFSKGDKTILQLFPKKNLRTCVMLLDMEDKFTFFEKSFENDELIYPYYQGSKSLKEKYGDLSYTKYFYYNKPLQDSINEALKIELEQAGIKNKKRLGLGEVSVYNNPKVYIRQSAKEIIATVDLEKSSANNSIYVFSLRNNSKKTIEFLYFLCGWLNSDLVTYFSQQRNIIRFSNGKQPQIKISDLGSIPVPESQEIKSDISRLCESYYQTKDPRNLESINRIVFNYYNLSSEEIETIGEKIKTF